MRLAHAMIGAFSYMRYSYHGDFMIPTPMGSDRRRLITMTSTLQASCSSWSSSQKGGRDDRIFGRQAGTQHRLHRVEVYNLEMILVMVTTLVMEKAFLNVEGGLNLEMILVMVMVLVMEEVFLNM